jgi:signal transduction histidine kinase
VGLVVLVAAAVGLVGAWQQSLALEASLQGQGRMLMDLLATSVRRTIEANRLLEESIARRLLDNARLIDRLFSKGPIRRAELEAVARRNGLSRVEILDPKGEMLASASSQTMMGQMMMGRGMHHGPMHARMGQHHRRMLLEPILRGKAREAMVGFGQKRFWLGGDYGVAVRRQAADGIVLITAPAEYILSFRREIGLQRLVDELARNPILERVVLLAPNLEVVADSRPDSVGRRLEDSFYREALGSGQEASRILKASGGRVLELARPVELASDVRGLLSLGVSLEASDRLFSRALRTVALYSMALALLGAAGLTAVFLTQERQRARLRALEREVEQRQRLSALGNLAAAVAHEVRNPLNAIGMGLQRLAGEFSPAREKDREEFGRIVETLRSEVDRLNGIVEDFLCLARPPRLALRACPPEELLSELERLIRPEAEARGIGFKIEGTERLPARVRWDPERLKEALWNVLLNALEATADGGSIRLEADTKGDWVVLTVRDTGRGIAREILERIFEPYFTTKDKGTGLGLPLARQIVEAHGGRMEVQSREAEGTAVSLWVPLRAAGQETQGAEA